MEKTLCIIKPDSFKSGYAPKINEDIKNAGFKIVKSVEKTLSEVEAKEFYAEHKERPFFNDLVSYMSSGVVVVQILERENCVKSFRELIGATNPLDAKEGTIRKKYGKSIDENAIHGSDSAESADREIKFFFPPNA